MAAVDDTATATVANKAYLIGLFISMLHSMDVFGGSHFSAIGINVQKINSSCSFDH
jgi:hypothetical protein